MKAMSNFSEHFKPSSKSMPKNQTEYLLCLTLDIGETMLKSGGEIYRVEDTIKRICEAYGAAHMEIFAIPSLILVTIHMPDGTYSTQIRRVYNTENDLYRLELCNSISRKICKETPPLEEVDQMIRETKSKPRYAWWIRAAAFTVGAGAFAVFFGGSWRDGICAALIGFLFFLIDMISFRDVNHFAKTAIQSFVGGMLSHCSVLIGLGNNVDMIAIGTIMLLIPGLAFGTALRDLLTGDFLAGTLKTIHILILALVIASGYLLSVFLLGGGL